MMCDIKPFYQFAYHHRSIRMHVHEQRKSGYNIVECGFNFKLVLERIFSLSLSRFLVPSRIKPTSLPCHSHSVPTPFTHSPLFLLHPTFPMSLPFSMGPRAFRCFNSFDKHFTVVDQVVYHYFKLWYMCVRQFGLRSDCKHFNVPTTIPFFFLNCNTRRKRKR